MELVVKRFHELTVDELYDICRMRIAVFIVEQDCPFQDLDGVDRHAYHMYLRDDEGIQAYVRIFPKGVTYDDASIGRVISMRRHTGLGTRIMKEAIDFIRCHFDADAITIGAQRYAVPFYEGVGFKEFGEGYLEDDIPHVHMRLEL